MGLGRWGRLLVFCIGVRVRYWVMGMGWLRVRRIWCEGLGRGMGTLRRGMGLGGLGLRGLGEKVVLFDLGDHD